MRTATEYFLRHDFSLRAVGKKFGIPFQSLAKYTKPGMKYVPPGHQQIFDLDVELKFVKYLQDMGDHGFALDDSQIMETAQHMVQNNKAMFVLSCIGRYNVELSLLCLLELIM